MDLNRKKKSSLHTKAVVFVTAFVFLFTSIAPAQMVSQPVLPSFISQPNIQIPQELGNIQESFSASEKSPSVFLIQDAHDSLDAQENIRLILKHLVEKEKVSAVCFEGGSQELNRPFYNFSKNIQTDRKIWDVLFKEGEIGGVERYALEAPSRTKFFGIEDSKTYFENIHSIQKCYEVSDKAQSSIRNKDAEFSSRAGRLLSGDAKKFRDLKDAFEQKRIDLERYAKQLSKWAPEISDSANQCEWPQLVRLLKLSEISSKLDIEKIKIPGNLKSLTNSASTKGHLRWHIEKLAEEGFNFEKTPQLNDWIGFQILQDELSASELFEEVERLQEQILSRMKISDEARKFFEEEHNWQLTKKLISLQLTRTEWEEAEKLPFAGLTQTARKNYKIVEARDQFLAGNTLSRIHDLQSKKTALVLGGFHTDKMAAFLKANNISYTIINPAIKNPDRKLNYRSRMTPPDQTGPVVVGASLGIPDAQPFTRHLVAKASSLGEREVSWQSERPISNRLIEEIITQSRKVRTKDGHSRFVVIATNIDEALGLLSLGEAHRAEIINKSENTSMILLFLLSKLLSHFESRAEFIAALNGKRLDPFLVGKLRDRETKTYVDLTGREKQHPQPVFVHVPFEEIYSALQRVPLMPEVENQQFQNWLVHEIEAAMSEHIDMYVNREMIEKIVTDFFEQVREYDALSFASKSWLKNDKNYEAVREASGEGRIQYLEGDLWSDGLSSVMHLVDNTPGETVLFLSVSDSERPNWSIKKWKHFLKANFRGHDSVYVVAESLVPLSAYCFSDINAHSLGNEAAVEGSVHNQQLVTVPDVELTLITKKNWKQEIIALLKSWAVSGVYASNEWFESMNALSTNVQRKSPTDFEVFSKIIEYWFPTRAKSLGDKGEDDALRFVGRTAQQIKYRVPEDEKAKLAGKLQQGSLKPDEVVRELKVLKTEYENRVRLDAGWFVGASLGEKVEADPIKETSETISKIHSALYRLKLAGRKPAYTDLAITAYGAGIISERPEIEEYLEYLEAEGKSEKYAEVFVRAAKAGVVSQTNSIQSYLLTLYSHEWYEAYARAVLQLMEAGFLNHPPLQFAKIYPILDLRGGYSAFPDIYLKANRLKVLPSARSMDSSDPEFLIEAYGEGLIQKKPDLNAYFDRLGKIKAWKIYVDILIKALEFGIITDEKEIKKHTQELKNNNFWIYAAQIELKAYQKKVIFEKPDLETINKQLEIAGFWDSFAEINELALSSGLYEINPEQLKRIKALSAELGFPLSLVSASLAAKQLPGTAAEIDDSFFQQARGTLETIRKKSLAGDEDHNQIDASAFKEFLSAALPNLHVISENLSKQILDQFLTQRGYLPLLEKVLEEFAFLDRERLRILRDFYQKTGNRFVDNPNFLLGIVGYLNAYCAFGFTVEDFRHDLGNGEEPADKILERLGRRVVRMIAEQLEIPKELLNDSRNVPNDGWDFRYLGIFISYRTVWDKSSRHLFDLLMRAALTGKLKALLNPVHYSEEPVNFMGEAERDWILKIRRHNLNFLKQLEAAGFNIKVWLNPDHAIDPVFVGASGKKNSYRIRFWTRNLAREMFLGNYANSCVALGRDASRFFEFFLDAGTHFVVIEDHRGRIKGYMRFFLSQDERGKFKIYIDTVDGVSANTYQSEMKTYIEQFAVAAGFSPEDVVDRSYSISSKVGGALTPNYFHHSSAKIEVPELDSSVDNWQPAGGWKTIETFAGSSLGQKSQIGSTTLQIRLHVASQIEALERRNWKDDEISFEKKSTAYAIVPGLPGEYWIHLHLRKKVLNPAPGNGLLFKMRIENNQIILLDPMAEMDMYSGNIDLPVALVPIKNLVSESASQWLIENAARVVQKRKSTIIRYVEEHKKGRLALKYVLARAVTPRLIGAWDMLRVEQFGNKRRVRDGGITFERVDKPAIAASLGRTREDYFVVIDGKKINLFDAMENGSMQTYWIRRFVPQPLEVVELPTQPSDYSIEEALKIAAQYKKTRYSESKLRSFANFRMRSFVKGISAEDLEWYLNAKLLDEAAQLLGYAHNSGAPLKSAALENGAMVIGRQFLIPISWIEEERIKKHQLVTVRLLAEELGVYEPALFDSLRHPSDHFNHQMMQGEFGNRTQLLEKSLASAYRTVAGKHLAVDIVTAWQIIRIFSQAVKTYQPQIAPYSNKKITTWKELMGIIRDWDTPDTLKERFRFNSIQVVNLWAERGGIRGVHVVNPVNDIGKWYFPPQEVQRIDAREKKRFEEIARFVRKYSGKSIKTCEDLLSAIQDWPKISELAAKSGISRRILALHINEGFPKAIKIDLLGMAQFGYVVPPKEAARWIKYKVKQAAKTESDVTGVGASLGSGPLYLNRSSKQILIRRLTEIPGIRPKSVDLVADVIIRRRPFLNSEDLGRKLLDANIDPKNPGALSDTTVSALQEGIKKDLVGFDSVDLNTDKEKVTDTLSKIQGVNPGSVALLAELILERRPFTSGNIREKLLLPKPRKLDDGVVKILINSVDNGLPLFDINAGSEYKLTTLLKRLPGIQEIDIPYIIQLIRSRRTFTKKNASEKFSEPLSQKLDEDSLNALLTAIDDGLVSLVLFDINNTPGGKILENRLKLIPGIPAESAERIASSIVKCRPFTRIDIEARLLANNGTMALDKQVIDILVRAVDDGSILLKKYRGHSKNEIPLVRSELTEGVFTYPNQPRISVPHDKEILMPIVQQSNPDQWDLVLNELKKVSNTVKPDPKTGRLPLILVIPGLTFIHFDMIADRWAKEGFDIGTAFVKELETPQVLFRDLLENPKYAEVKARLKEDFDREIKRVGLFLQKLNAASNNKTVAQRLDELKRREQSNDKDYSLPDLDSLYLAGIYRWGIEHGVEFTTQQKPFEDFIRDHDAPRIGRYIYLQLSHNDIKGADFYADVDFRNTAEGIFRNNRSIWFGLEKLQQQSRFNKMGIILPMVKSQSVDFKLEANPDLNEIESNRDNEISLQAAVYFEFENKWKSPEERNEYLWALNIIDLLMGTIKSSRTYDSRMKIVNQILERMRQKKISVKSLVAKLATRLSILRQSLVDFDEGLITVYAQKALISVLQEEQLITAPEVKVIVTGSSLGRAESAYGIPEPFIRLVGKTTWKIYGTDLRRVDPKLFERILAEEFSSKLPAIQFPEFIKTKESALVITGPVSPEAVLAQISFGKTVVVHYSDDEYKRRFDAQAARAVELGVLTQDQLKKHAHLTDLSFAGLSESQFYEKLLKGERIGNLRSLNWIKQQAGLVSSDPVVWMAKDSVIDAVSKKSIPGMAMPFVDQYLVDASVKDKILYDIERLALAVKLSRGAEELKSQGLVIFQNGRYSQTDRFLQSFLGNAILKQQVAKLIAVMA